MPQGSRQKFARTFRRGSRKRSVFFGVSGFWVGLGGPLYDLLFHACMARSISKPASRKDVICHHKTLEHEQIHRYTCRSEKENRTLKSKTNNKEVVVNKKAASASRDKLWRIIRLGSDCRKQKNEEKENKHAKIVSQNGCDTVCGNVLCFAVFGRSAMQNSSAPLHYFFSFLFLFVCVLDSQERSDFAPI